MGAADEADAGAADGSAGTFSGVGASVRSTDGGSDGAPVDGAPVVVDGSAVAVDGARDGQVDGSSTVWHLSSQ